METSQAVIDAIAANEVARARELVQQDPRLARGNGSNGESPVLAALYRGHGELALLIARNRELSLPEAAALGDPDQVAIILKQDQKAVATRSSDGWTALHLAAFMGHAEVARILLDHDADLEAVSRNGIANRPLHAALAGKGSPEVVELLLARGADVNATAEANVTPIHLAAARGAMDFTRRLLELGADPAARMTDGKLAAAFASERGHPEVADFLNGLSANRGAGFGDTG